MKVTLKDLSKQFEGECDTCKQEKEFDFFDLITSDGEYLLCKDCKEIWFKSPEAALAMKYLIAQDVVPDRFNVAEIVIDEKKMRSIRLMEGL